VLIPPPAYHEPSAWQQPKVQATVRDGIINPNKIMKTNTMISQFTVHLAALSLLFATAGLADGIPEPSLVMYGSVTNTAGSFALMSGGVQ
jgi:hypothetical protein